MLTRSEFDKACKDFIAKYASILPSPETSPMVGWSWNEHPFVSGLGYMTRDTSYLKRMDSIDDPNLFIADTEGSDEATMITSSAIPCFYFNMYDCSGSPLSLDGILQTALFRPCIVDIPDKTSFSIGQQGASFPLLSQGDHPTLGTPCWYFHPCETEAAVGELMAEKGQSSALEYIETWFCVVGSVVDLRI